MLSATSLPARCTRLLPLLLSNRPHASFDDVRELHLAVGSHAEEVGQLAAADEYRRTFAATTIANSVQAGNGLRVRLPGVHSDIGGSYREEEMEERNVSADEARRYLRARWYPAAQLMPINVFKRWYRGRRALTNGYQFIGGTIRMNRARDASKHQPLAFVPFESGYEQCAVPGELHAFYELMDAFVASRPGPTFGLPKPGHPPTQNDDYSRYQPAAFELPVAWSWIRNCYLHRSARHGEWTLEGFTMAGRRVEGVAGRQIIQVINP